MTGQQDDIQRTLGRLEGKVDQILAANAKMDAEMTEHKAEDRQNFQAVSSRFGVVYKKLEDQDEARATSFENLEARLKVINGYMDNIKGAWWMVTLITVVVAGIGGAIVWFIGIVRS